MVTNSGPGYKKHPEHRVVAKPAVARIQVVFNGEVIADSEDAIRLEETGHDPVYYLPRKHVEMDRLIRTTHRTHCPFKGDASYFTLSSGRTEENAVWSYEEPYDEVSVIKDRLAFYHHKVDSITAIERGVIKSRTCKGGPPCPPLIQTTALRGGHGGPPLQVLLLITPY